MERQAQHFPGLLPGSQRVHHTGPLDRGSKAEFEGKLLPEPVIKRSIMQVPAFLAVLALSFYPCVLRAQTTNRLITGRVTDPSRAIIADTKVAAVNTGTNSRYESATNGAGEYTLANLPPRTYRVEVEKSGFKKLVRPEVTLHVQDALAIDLEMAVGSVSETVRVERARCVTLTGCNSILSPSPVSIAIRHTDNESHGSRQFRSACGNPTSNSDKFST